MAKKCFKPESTSLKLPAKKLCQHLFLVLRRHFRINKKEEKDYNAEITIRSREPRIIHKISETNSSFHIK